MDINKSDAALEELRSEEQVELMDAIDLLRSQNFDKRLDLPQIIVCGNQSSGKSSVLEAISGLPFPTGHGLVTRFATEIALRKAPQDAIRASIQPGSNTSGTQRQDLRAKSEQLQNLATEGGDLHAIMKLAVEHMKPDRGDSKFSPHRLRIEISGPHRDDLTLVDLPGLIAWTTSAQSAADITIIRSMVESYMREPGSIILAVTPACVDPETQEVFRLAADVDADGSRTMGILTMPDMTQRGAEQDFIKLLKNEKIKLQLGWHVLKNPNSAEEPTASRDDQEASFFAEVEPWNMLPPKLRGVSELRIRLRDVLFEKLTRGLPTIVLGIDGQILSHERKLEAFGPPRQSRDERLQYMERLCTRISNLIKEGAEASYEGTFFQENSGTNEFRLLCTVLRKLQDQFSNGMRHAGARYCMPGDPSGRCPHHNRDIMTTGVTLNPTGPPACLTTEAMLEAIIAHVARFQGPQLPDEFPERAMSEIFKIMSSPWESLARQHAAQCLSAAQKFTHLILRETAPTSARALVDEIVAPRFRDCESRLKDKITELLSPYRQLRPRAYNPAYALKMLEFEGQSTGRRYSTVHGRAAQQTLNRVNAYYELSLNTFIDNVATLAIENCIVEPLRSMLNPSTIYDLALSNPDVFDRISSESKSVQIERSETELQLETMRQVRQICNKYEYYQAEPVDVGATDIGIDESQYHFEDTVPLTRISTPEPEASAHLFATRGDPIAFTPPRTPESKPRATPSRLGKTPESGRRSAASISTSSLRNTGSGVFDKGRPAQVSDGSDDEL